MTKQQKWAFALSRRDASGWTFKRIGKKLRVGPSRAREIYNAGHRYLRLPMVCLDRQGFRRWTVGELLRRWTIESHYAHQ